MRKTNKFVSLLLVLGMMFTLFVPVQAANELSFTDVPSEHTYYEAITNLAAEGILNGMGEGLFKPDDGVTRAQFTKIICYAQGVGNLTYSEGNRAKFIDVDPNHWAIDNITTAKNSGIINGYDDGTFKPETPVLYEQAVKMVVCALGYTEAMAIRESVDGNPYPYGYINIASKKAKILGGLVNVKMGEPLTRGAIAQLVDNMMDASLYDPEEGTTGTTMREETSTRKTDEGKVVASYERSIYYDEPSTCNKVQIMIERPNGTTAFYGIENLSIDNIDDYLGRNVTVYYEEENGVEYFEATNIVIEKRKNQEVKVNFDAIEGFDNGKLSYIAGDEEDVEKLSIASDIKIILNGQTIDGSFSDIVSTYEDGTGYMTLVCADSSDVADIVFVKSYETIFVNNTKDTKNYKVTDYSDSSKFFILNEKDRTKRVTITKDGVKSNFASIPSVCVVSVSVSTNGKILDAQVSTKTEKGTIMEMVDGNIRLDKTGSTFYEFAESCDMTATINTGSYVTIYLDAFGKIARYAVTTDSHTYGYLATVEEGTINEPEIEVFLVKASSSNTTATGKYYKLKENVKIDGTSYSVSKKRSEIVGILRDSAGGLNASIVGNSPDNASFAQPIRYKLNSSNEVESLLTVNYDSDYGTDYLINHTASDAFLECKTDGTTLDKYNISSSQIMLIPDDRIMGTYTTKGASYFKKGTKYFVQLGNVSSTNKPAVVYVYGTTAGADLGTEVISEENVPMIVTYVYDSKKNEKTGEFGRCLRLLNTETGLDGYEVFYDDIAGTEAAETVVKGDVVRVAADDNNLIDAFTVVAKAEDILDGTQDPLITFDGTDSDDLEAPLRTFLGTVKTNSEGTIVMVPSLTDPDEEELPAFDDNGANVFVVNTEDSDVYTQGMFSDASDGSKIMVYTADGEIVSIIVFE